MKPDIALPKRINKPIILPIASGADSGGDSDGVVWCGVVWCGVH